MKYNKETFTQELKRRFPGNEFEILEFFGTYKPIKYKCLKCNRIIEKNRANHLYENKSLCQHCYPTRDSSIRNWIYNFFKNTNNFKLISWSSNTADDILMHCNICDRDFKKQPGNLYKRKDGTICPYCGDNGFPVIQEEYEKMMIENGYIDYKIISYKSMMKSVTLQHSCGYVFS